MGTIGEQADILRRQWETDPRWAGIERTYSADDVIRLRGPVAEEHTRARLGATRLWDLLHSQDAVSAFGAISGGQAERLANEGPHAVYLSGGHLAADENFAEQNPGHPAHPSPAMVRRISKALLRAGHVAWSERSSERSEETPAQKRLAPVVAEADSSGALDAFELMTDMIEAGVAGVHFEDGLSSELTGGHIGGKVLIPTGQHIKTLNAARLAADVLGVPALIIARTAATGATLLASDADERDHEFLTGERTEDGFHRVRPSLYACVTRGLAFAPYADLLWLETETPDLAEARAFAQIIHSQYPDKLLAFSCSPSCDWRAHMDDADLADFQKELAAMGYRFQFIAPAGSRALGQEVPSCAPPRDTEPAGPHGHNEAGTRYSDLVTRALARDAQTEALAASLESAHFVGHDQLDHHGRLVPAD